MYSIWYAPMNILAFHIKRFECFFFDRAWNSMFYWCRNVFYVIRMYFYVYIDSNKYCQWKSFILKHKLRKLSWMIKFSPLILRNVCCENVILEEKLKMGQSILNGYFPIANDIEFILSNFFICFNFFSKLFRHSNLFKIFKVICLASIKLIVIHL